MLVEAGAEVRVLDDEDMIPLLNPVKGNHAAVVTYLVQHGADPNDVSIDEKKRGPQPAHGCHRG